MIKILFSSLLFFISIICGAQHLWLPAVFSDNMVLQRESNVPVWGKSIPNSEVRVEIDQFSFTTKANNDGKWMVRLSSHSAGGPYILKISSGENKSYRNVMFGDVWFASGQSNMAFPVIESINGQEELRNANYPNIRICSVRNELSINPREEVAGGPWVICDSNSARYFSAVAFFFGRKIFLDKNIPIGLICSSWGGTMAEPWTSQEALNIFPENRKQIEDLKANNITDETLVQNEKNWAKKMDITVNSNAGLQQKVIESGYDDKKWKSMQVPVSLDQTEVGKYWGVAWFRKKVDLPASYQSKDLILKIGKIGLRDITYFNGVKVGESTWTLDLIRTYKIPAKLVKKGLNVITIRNAVAWNPGGLQGPADSMQIFVEADKNIKPVSLAGTWKYSIDIEPKVPFTQDYNQLPGLIFNAMVAPVIPYGIKGALWYQGESNAGNPEKYKKLLPTMINDWRIRWNQGYFPFLIVQLPNFQAAQIQPVEHGWAEMRNAQFFACKYPQVGIVTTIDIGDPVDIHPANKQDVGKRLALLAEKMVYGDNIVYTGPTYQSMRKEGNKIYLKFSNTGSGMVVKEGRLKGFAIADDTDNFQWANAEINGDEIVVSSDKISNPIKVKYAWANNPDCNLFNKEGFPASPFSTEEFEP